MSDYEPLPSVEDISTVFGNKTVVISWDYTKLIDYYNSYFIEKSIDKGNTFNRVSKLPITNMNEKDGKPNGRINYIDSLKDNTTSYIYRVRGINPFGEVGPPSVMSRGKGKSLLPFVPNISKSVIDNKGVLQLTWEFDEKGNDLIIGFIVNKASKADGKYETGYKRYPA